jgi:hypothetical protein
VAKPVATAPALTPRQEAATDQKPFRPAGVKAHQRHGRPAFTHHGRGHERKEVSPVPPSRARGHGKAKGHQKTHGHGNRNGNRRNGHGKFRD